MSIECGSNEIHIWHLHADVDATTLATLQETLSDGERAQAARFHFSIDRQRYLARRGLVRATLAKYVDALPTSLLFINGTYGKPSLAIDIAHPLHFNYSYSGNALLLAISRSYEIGVDIEAVQTLPDARAIAQQNFSTDEQQILARLDYASNAFFTCWSAKEAVIKALGSGLSRPLHDFTTLTDGGALEHEFNIFDYDHGREQCIRLHAVSSSSQTRATLAILLPMQTNSEPIVIEHNAARDM